MTYATSGVPQPSQKWSVQIPATGIKPFRNRVRVLTEVLDDTIEIALVTAAFEKKGWAVRQPGNDEVRGYPSKDRAWLAVEVRFGGHRKGAASVAVKRIEDVADRFQLGVWVRYAEVIRFPPEPQRTYYIDERPERSLPKRKVLQRALKVADRPRTFRLIRLPASVRESDVPAELARYAPRSPFHSHRESIRAAVQGIPEGEGEDLIPGSPAWRIRLASIVLAMSFGVPTVWAPGMWKVLLVLVGLMTATAFVRAEPAGQKTALRISMGVYRASTSTVVGIVLGAAIHRGQPTILGAAAYVFFTGPGLLNALRDWELARNLSWLVPLAVTVFVPLALGLGGMFDTEYLTYGFGIPADAVSLPTFWRVAIVGKPILFGVAIVIFIVACLGWARHFHLFGSDPVNRRFMVLMAAGIAVVYLLTSISISLDLVNTAAQSAAAEARGGRQPATYFGLQGVLECVRPVADGPIAIYNGPLPAPRPMLSFGFSGTQLWVWDPRSGRAISVALQDVTVTPAAGAPAHC